MTTTEIPNLTEDELWAMAVTLAVPVNPCESCCSIMPGVIAPCYPDGDMDHLFVECCDECTPDDPDKSDTAAALRIAKVLGLNVRRRFDNETLECWRPFLTRPGSPDDVDVYAVGASWCGAHADEEHVVPVDRLPVLEGA